MADEPKMTFEAPPAAPSALAENACGGEFKRHRYGDDQRCKRCGQERPPAQLESLRQRAAGAPPRAAKAIDEAAGLRAKREQIARVIAKLPHQAQATVARYLYQYDGNAFELSDTEKNALGKCWLDVFEAFDWQPESPWFSVGALALMEAEICSRQWRQMVSDVAENTVKR